MQLSFCLNFYIFFHFLVCLDSLEPEQRGLNKEEQVETTRKERGQVPCACEGWVWRTAQDSHVATRLSHEEELWFLSLSAVWLASLVPTSAFPALCLPGGKWLCRESITEDPGLGWDRERMESLHKTEHGGTEALLSGKGNVRGRHCKSRKAQAWLTDVVLQTAPIPCPALFVLALAPIQETQRNHN